MAGRPPSSFHVVGGARGETLRYGGARTDALQRVLKTELGRNRGEGPPGETLLLWAASVEREGLDHRIVEQKRNDVVGRDPEPVGELSACGPIRDVDQTVEETIVDEEGFRKVERQNGFGEVLVDVELTDEILQRLPDVAAFVTYLNDYRPSDRLGQESRLIEESGNLKLGERKLL